MLEGSLWSEPPFCLGVLPSPMSVFADLFPDWPCWMGTRKGAQLLSLCFLSVLSRNCWAKSSISQGKFIRVVQTRSGFSFFLFFFELLLKTSAKYYQWEGKSTKKSEMQLNQPLKKYQSEWRRKALHFFNFLHLTRDSCFQRKSLLTPQTIVQLCPVFSETVHN